MVTKALAALQKLRYTGESKNFNWEKYVNKHEENHNILQSMVGRGDYTGMGETQKVSILLEGIHCQPVEFLKGTIFSNPSLYLSFDKASMLFGDYIHHNKSHASLNHQGAQIGIGAFEMDEEPAGDAEEEEPHGESKKKSLTKIKRQEAMDHWTTQPEWDTLTLE
jgi:hypothetical protein